MAAGRSRNSESDVSECISNLVIEGNSPYDAKENEDQELVQTLKRFWEIEHYGVEENFDKRTNEFYDFLTGGEKQLQSNETNVSFSGQEKQVCSNHFDAQFKGKRYEVGLPWRDDLVCDPISSDYRLCRDRLKSLYVKLKGKPELMVELMILYLVNNFAQALWSKFQFLVETKSEFILCHIMALYAKIAKLANLGLFSMVAQSKM